MTALALDVPIQLHNVSKTYKLGFWMNRKVQALQGLDLTLRAGQVFGLLGPNGAGKSTTIKILMNLVQASSGDARLFGMPSSSQEARRQVGFLPENPAPYEYLTGAEFVRLAGQLGGLSGADLDRRVKEVLGSVEMTRAGNLQIRRYSKGMVQRIGLAQALVNSPKLLILDEPTSGLDPVGRRHMRDLILAEREKGTTVLFCTHIIPDVEALCDSVAVLVGGRRVREGTVQELLTGQSPLVEVTVAGLSRASLDALGFSFSHVQEMQDRVRLRVTDADTQAFLKRVLEQGGKVTQVQSARFSLEDLFLKELEGAKQSVGGEMS